MNWLGKLLQKEIDKKDTVLDLGCGIFQAIEGIKCKSILGVEIVQEYIDIAKYKYPVIRFDISETTLFDIFSYSSFDVVIMLDVLEHLDYDIITDTINDMKHVARKKVIIYTPSKFETNEQNIINTWNISGTFETQRHKSFIDSEYLQVRGFKISFPEPDKNTLAVWSKV